jgi:hypothetical protein
MNDSGKRMLPFYHCAKFIRVNPPFKEHSVCQILYHHFNIIVGTTQEFLHEWFACVRKRAVPYIMEKCRGDYQCVLSITKSEPA